MDLSLKIILFALSFIPGAGPFVVVFENWWPVIQQGLPVALDLIQRGANAYGAFESAHPKLFDAFRALAAQAEFGDASRADEITKDDAIDFASPLFGKPWTNDMRDRWYKQADGNA